jgi:hypothetical protein
MFHVGKQQDDSAPDGTRRINEDGPACDRRTDAKRLPLFAGVSADEDADQRHTSSESSHLGSTDVFFAHEGSKIAASKRTAGMRDHRCSVVTSLASLRVSGAFIRVFALADRATVRWSAARPPAAPV